MIRLPAPSRIDCHRTPRRSCRSAPGKATLLVGTLTFYLLATHLQAETLRVEFAVPAEASAPEGAPCRASLSFADNGENSRLVEIISGLMAERDQMTLAISNGEAVVEIRGGEIKELWANVASERWASCSIRCVQLPSESKVTQLIFTDEDGFTECLRKPVVGNLPQISGVSCGSTLWRDILVKRARKGRVLICATAVSWIPMHVSKRDQRHNITPQTKNRMTVEYK